MGKAVLARVGSLTSDPASGDEPDSDSPPTYCEAQAQQRGPPAAAGELSADKLKDEVTKHQGVIRRGIEKRLRWKPIRESSTATYSFEGSYLRQSQDRSRL